MRTSVCPFQDCSCFSTDSQEKSIFPTRPLCFVCVLALFPYLSPSPSFPTISHLLVFSGWRCGTSLTFGSPQPLAWCFFYAQCHFNSRSLRKNPFTGNPAKDKVHLRCANLTDTTKQYYIQVFRVWLPENRWEKRKLYLLLVGGSTWKCGRSL